MQYPKITVITPSFNSSRFIESTLKSVIDQQYPNLEYILMEGGSTDGTVEIIARYEKHLATWVSEKDLGQYDAINKGFAKSSGEILCWLNADDMLLPNSLFLVADIFHNLPQVEWLSSLKPGSWDANGHLVSVDILPGFSQKSFLDGLYLPTTNKKGYWLQQESTFWRRSLWEKSGSSIPNSTWAGDFALWCVFYEHTDLYGVDYPLAGFRMIEGQRSEDFHNYMLQANEALSQLRKQLGWTPHFSRLLYYGNLSQIRRVRQWLKSKYGYKGQRITKTNLRSLDAPWKIESDSFLP